MVCFILVTHITPSFRNSIEILYTECYKDIHLIQKDITVVFWKLKKAIFSTIVMDATEDLQKSIQIPLIFLDISITENDDTPKYIKSANFFYCKRP